MDRKGLCNYCGKRAKCSGDEIDWIHVKDMNVHVTRSFNGSNTSNCMIVVRDAVKFISNDNSGLEFCSLKCLERWLESL